MRETCQHVLRGHGFLTHARRRGLQSYDHTTGIVHQIVVVVPHPSWRTTVRGIGGIRIGGRDLILLMHRT